jgi:DNA-directed RNA polymerase subunit L
MMMGYDCLIEGQDHTFGNMIQTWLVDHHVDGDDNPRITFAGYKIPHPLKDEMLLRIGVQDNSEVTVRGAIAMAARGCKAWASGEGWVNVVLNSGGGAVMDVHKGQSIVLADAVLSSSPCTTSFITPVPVHTMSMPLGLSTSDAMATPTDNANNTSTRRVSWMAWRSCCMRGIMTHVKTQSKCPAKGRHTQLY